ncbi:protein NTM1-like 9 [Hibiscus syriacus]|uniref:protein NTM1-like 9 n=1 Tax=Hibiscus syriacus TaxID=106335 RepID=UPI0019232550|nr:protein NTM1-like 9 [Hibiscus syriacus]
MNYCSCNEIVGYRFHPTDKELIDHYLWNKALDRDSAVQAIGEVIGDLSDWEPGELPGFSARRSNDRTWYLFSRRNHCKRVKRTTKLGYWKLTGKHRSIKAKVGIGTKKTLVFYEGRVPQGKWTPWVIHEYTLPDTLPNQKGYFLCKLKKKDDAKTCISSAEEGQPSNAAEDKPFDNPSVIDVDELLAQINDSIEVEHDNGSVQKSQMNGEHVPVSLCNATYIGDDFDGVHNQSSTNEQNDEIYVISSSLQTRVYEETMISHDDFSFFCGCDENDHEIQHQSSTNKQPSTAEQDDEIQRQQSGIDEQVDEIQHQQSGIDEQDDEIQHQPGIDERYDEFFNSVLVDDDELFCLCENDDFILG